MTNNSLNSQVKFNHSSLKMYYLNPAQALIP